MAPSRSRLAHALEEATSIARLFHPNAEAVLGKAATESWFKGNARNYRVLHLATHGYFNKLNPLLSGLQLESDLDNDGLLEVHEILDLRLNSELVTLSACETGLGSGFFAEIPAGDDFFLSKHGDHGLASGQGRGIDACAETTEVHASLSTSVLLGAVCPHGQCASITHNS
jgi:CHAT domain-containing protein